MKSPGFFLVLPLLVLMLPAEAQVYRCETEGNVEFSDRPCADDAREYQPVHGISVIEPTADFDRIAEQNKAFINERRERQEVMRQARAERARESATAPPVVQYVQEQPVTRVLYIPEPRESSRRQRGTPPDSRSQEREQRPYSALSGPFPGTRRTEQRPRRDDPETQR